jgi:hypothetical protein
MRRLSFLFLILASLLIVSDGKTQTWWDLDRPMWTMEFIKAKPGMVGLTLGYLDDNWMRVREEAKRKGAVVDYHRLVEQSDSDSSANIILVTEFRNQIVFFTRDELFSSIREQFPNSHSGVIRSLQPYSLYEVVSTGDFVDHPETYKPPF